MQGGAFLTSRELFGNPIWKNIVEFRLFFLIYGNAVFSEEGVRIAENLILQRGQWLRSTRKIQDDLEFIENRQVKKYSTSTINRCIKSLQRMQRICTKEHELGTVFTVLNYEQYQGFGNYKNSNLEHNLEHSRNSDRTVTEQSQNNNNKDIKDMNEINDKKGRPNPSHPNKKTTYSEDDNYYLMALYLHSKIMEYAASINKAHLLENANLQSWADDFRKIVEIDKRDKAELREVIDWATSDSFWQANILSASKLRKQYTQLALKMNMKHPQLRQSRTEKNKELLQQKMQEARGYDESGDIKAIERDFFSL